MNSIPQDRDTAPERTEQAGDRFLARVGHELRTPLNAILGFTGTLLLKLPGPLTPDQEKQLRTVQGSARHLLALIDDLLELARIESGPAAWHPEPIDCRDLVEETVMFLRLEAEARGLRFETDVAPGLVVRCPRRALGRILRILTSNAIRFTEKGGVFLRVAGRRRGDRAVTEFDVRDTGVGIGAAEQARLFEAFARPGTARPRGPEGSGLGLYLSRKLADRLGAQLTCRSALGQGSTFTLTLPEPAP
jgi:protein-histidine pros-kinase